MALITNRIILDTSAYSGFNRGEKRLKEFFNADNELLVPLIVIGELRAGFSLGTQRNKNEMMLQRFLDSPNVNFVTITDTTTKFFAAIFHQLKKAGKPVSTNDMWIAALALEHDCLLVTLDSDFKRIPDLLLANLY